jgi:hypothetical protein
MRCEDYILIFQNSYFNIVGNSFKGGWVMKLWTYYDNNDKMSEYLSEMKAVRYEQTVYDATISSTVTLENKNQIISTTMISGFEEFKIKTGDKKNG